MNIVKSGSRLQIYGNDVQTFQQLPVGCYDVVYNKMEGFSLVCSELIKTKEEKIYGTHEEKVQKILKSFSVTKRNLGVILSGSKGIGKTLFAQLLAEKAIEKELPVLVVSAYAPGIEHFLASIEQEVVVIFDEFEKAFQNDKSSTDQEELLPLFDGLTGGKKLFLVICNYVSGLNNFFLNRPGRFHYHFNLTFPKSKEVREYLADKLLPEYQKEIDAVINFISIVPLSFDCLRAIVFELNQGYTFAQAMQDLNIARYNKNPVFNVILTMMDGTTFMGTTNLDVYSAFPKSVYLYDNHTELLVEIVPKHIKIQDDKITLPVKDVDCPDERIPSKHSGIKSVELIPVDSFAVDKYLFSEAEINDYCGTRDLPF